MTGCRRSWSKWTWPVWLGEADGDPVALLRPAADRVLKLWPVSRAVNTPRNNSADLLKPIETSYCSTHFQPCPI